MLATVKVIFDLLISLYVIHEQHVLQFEVNETETG